MNKIIISACLILAASSTFANPSNADSFTQKKADWACNIIFISDLKSFKSKLSDMTEGGMTINSLSAKDFSPTKITCTVNYTLDNELESSQKSFYLTGPLENLDSVKGLNSGHRYDVMWLDNSGKIVNKG
ncbi:DUF3617 family protein [Vibrio crassostreae]|nr:conserved exported hypothetical protein [Vibrio chagasii]CAK2859754.1 DUF3617 family protein [Vibrio crassostreae]